ncbi:MAG: diacylglycerol kinase family lipid kinase [bacterium]|nr:MAG: diacylglycerol kinase family lipid kinase [bacterium]
MEKYTMIINPSAGRGKGTRLEESIRKLVIQELGDMEIYNSEYPGHARKLAAELKEKCAVIVAVGGDGTINEVVNGMMGGKAALAVIPIGSGNDFTKMLRLPKDISYAIQVIKRNQRKRIDVGKVGDRYFPNGMGIGFDAWVVRESTKVHKLRGFLIYLYAVLKTVFLYKNSMVDVTIDGENQSKNIFLIAVGNGKAMGGGFYLTPEAEFDDGLLDVCIIRSLNKKEVFLNLPKAIKGNHMDLEQVTMLRVNNLHVHSELGIAAHADGELLGMDLKDLEISVIPSSLEVIFNSEAE